jgi:hypothetical protein
MNRRRWEAEQRRRAEEQAALAELKRQQEAARVAAERERLRQEQLEQEKRRLAEEEARRKEQEERERLRIQEELERARLQELLRATRQRAATRIQAWFRGVRGKFRCVIFNLFCDDLVSFYGHSSASVPASSCCFQGFEWLVSVIGQVAIAGVQRQHCMAGTLTSNLIAQRLFMCYP